MRNPSWITWRWLLTVFLAAMATCAAAQPTVDSPSTMHRQVWTARDGAPSPVVGLAQTNDGWLWLGTPTGLFRFDGIRFERMAELGGTRLPQNSISHLYASRDGTLWIGFVYGGIGRYRNGALQTYGAEAGLPLRSSVFAILERGDHSVWAATAAGLFRFDGHVWNRIGHADALRALLEDRAGVLWTRDARGQVFALNHRDSEPRRIGNVPWSTDGVTSLVEGSEGLIWTGDAQDRLHAFDASGERALPAPQKAAAPMIADPAGVIWYTSASGLAHAKSSAWTQAPASTSQQDSPSRTAFITLLRDREGNFWAGTLQGLERWRATRLHRVALPATPGVAGTAATIAADSQRRLWVATDGHPLLKMGASEERVEVVREQLVFLYVDPHDVGWAGDTQGRLWQIRGTAATPVPTPEPSQPYPLFAATEDAAGRLLVSGKGGLYRRDGEQWVSLVVRGLPPEPALALYTDPRGRVWAGYRQSRIFLVDGDNVTSLGPPQGLDVGNVLAFHMRSSRLWVAGDAGVALLRADGRFQTLAGAGRGTFEGVSGLVETAEGDVWLNTSEGVVHLPKPEIERFASEAAYRPTFERFDDQDGLEGVPQQLHNLPTIAATADGRLWFSTSSGVWWIDPAAIARNRTPPSVFVRGLRAAGRDWLATPGLELPKHTNSIEIDYTATSLSMPDRVRFRYRMDGIDQDWHEAGSRRTAYYTNPGPGPHRLHVIAANEDGVWSPEEAVFAFSVQPALYQTLWFRVAAALALLALATIAYLMRVRQLTARAAERLHARLMERERIAGELHDTLLQGVQALLLQMQLVLNQMSDPRTRQRLDHAIEVAERLVVDGRDRIAGLRDTSGLPDDLPRMLRQVVDELSSDQALPVKLEVSGTLPSMTPEQREELVFVAREALLNALRHADAQQVHVSLQGLRDGARLIVRDDGRGIPLEVLSAGAVEGHWGLPGMRERALRAGARLHIRRGEAAGTVVELFVPGPPPGNLLRRLVSMWPIDRGSPRHPGG